MKSPKPLSTKKPPVPVEDHQIIEDFIANARPTLTAILTEIDRLVREQLDDPRFAIKWSKAYYGTPERGWCVEVAAYDVSANIVFLNGSRLKAPPEMGGGETRYVKITSLDELDSPQLLAWIKQSCSMAGWEW